MRKFRRVVEDYLADLRKIRASSGATGERSGYGPLANLLNEIGGGLKPKVFCVGESAELQGWLREVRLVRNRSIECVPAGLPDCGVRV